MDRRVAIGMAIVGLAVMGLESIVIAPASASVVEAMHGGSLVGLQQVALQILLVGMIVTVLAIELIHRSRVAYVATLLIGLVPAAWWVALVAAADPLAFQPIPLRLAATSLLVLAGLGLDWAAFWHQRGGALRA